MRPSILRRSSFLLGFSAAVGILSSLALVALAGPDSSTRHEKRRPPGHPTSSRHSTEPELLRTR